jgi:hypothetical protein
MPVASDVRLEHGVVIFHPELVNLYGCRIGDGTRIGSFVEIQKNATCRYSRTGPSAGGRSRALIASGFRACRSSCRKWFNLSAVDKSRTIYEIMYKIMRMSPSKN